MLGGFSSSEIKTCFIGFSRKLPELVDFIRIIYCRKRTEELFTVDQSPARATLLLYFEISDMSRIQTRFSTVMIFVSFLGLKASK